MHIRRIAALVTIAVLGFYLLLLNPFWVPGGDSELYVAVARSWALGNGHMFNGQSVSISPPGWPLLLAGVFRISTSFLFLKLITIACMTGAMSIWFWILLRFTIATHRITGGVEQRDPSACLYAHVLDA